MILLILLLMIAFGAGIFIVNQAIGCHESESNYKKFPAKTPIRRRSRRQIEKDLDQLILLKKNDAIDEKQFCNQADQLID